MQSKKELKPLAKKSTGSKTRRNRSRAGKKEKNIELSLMIKKAMNRRIGQ